jgi:energy-converting hydrogenase Eha subunit E
MVIMIDITVESTGLSIKFLTFNSLYAIIAFDYILQVGATTFVRPHLLLPEG